MRSVERTFADRLDRHGTRGIALPSARELYGLGEFEVFALTVANTLEPSGGPRGPLVVEVAADLLEERIARTDRERDAALAALSCAHDVWRERANPFHLPEESYTVDAVAAAIDCSAEELRRCVERELVHQPHRRGRRITALHATALWREWQEWRAATAHVAEAAVLRDRLLGPSPDDRWARPIDAARARTVAWSLFRSRRRYVGVGCAARALGLDQAELEAVTYRDLVPSVTMFRLRFLDVREVALALAAARESGRQVRHLPTKLGRRKRTNPTAPVAGV